MTAGKIEALEPIEALEDHEREYWRNQLHALLVGLDDQGTPVSNKRATLMLRHLRDALLFVALGPVFGPLLSATTGSIAFQMLGASEFDFDTARRRLDEVATEWKRARIFVATGT